MKILQVGSNSIHVSSYISALNKAADVHIYLLAEEQCDFDGIESQKTIGFRSLNPLRIIQSTKLLTRYLKELQPDVIHIHQVNRLAYFVSRAAAKLKIPIVTTAWGSDVLLIPQKNPFFFFLIKKTLERSSVVTADSQDMIEAMSRIVPEEKYQLVQYGIDPIQSKTKEKIIFSNRLHKPLYRIDSIINYFNEFQKTHSDWKLIIGGTGSETETLKAQANSFGLKDKIEFVGWLQKEANSDWYARSTIYISIPISDGTSISVLEAMSAGCIPVVADLPVSKEWIQSGINGVIESKDKNPLVEALLLNTLKCSEINNKLISEKATREASIAVFLTLYSKAINGK